MGRGREENGDRKGGKVEERGEIDREGGASKNRGKEGK